MEIRRQGKRLNLRERFSQKVSCLDTSWIFRQGKSEGLLTEHWASCLPADSPKPVMLVKSRSGASQGTCFPLENFLCDWVSFRKFVFISIFARAIIADMGVGFGAGRQSLSDRDSMIRTESFTFAQTFHRWKRAELKADGSTLAWSWLITHWCSCEYCSWHWNSAVTVTMG